VDNESKRLAFEAEVAAHGHRLRSILRQTMLLDSETALRASLLASKAALETRKTREATIHRTRG
jgi:hypothetical protein